MSKFIPALRYVNGSVEVFTSKFDGLLFSSISRATDYAINNRQLCYKCDTKKIAKSIAKDAILSCHAGLELSQAEPSFITVL